MCVAVYQMSNCCYSIKESETLLTEVRTKLLEDTQAQWRGASQNIVLISLTQQ